MQKVESSFDPAIIKDGLYVPSHPGGLNKKTGSDDVATMTDNE